VLNFLAEKKWSLTLALLPIVAHLYIQTGIFSLMLLFTAVYKAQLILVNRQDYLGSTLLTNTKLASLGSQNLQICAKALAQQGLDIGLFLTWLIREEKIPPVSIDPDGNK
jgi:hypothetical protein